MYQSATSYILWPSDSIVYKYLFMSVYLYVYFPIEDSASCIWKAKLWSTSFAHTMGPSGLSYNPFCITPQLASSSFGIEGIQRGENS